MKEYVIKNIVVATLMLCLLLAGCGGESQPGAPNSFSPSGSTGQPGVATIQISPASLSLKGIGTEVELGLVVRFNNGDVLTDVQESFVDPVSGQRFEVVWTTDNEFVANFEVPGRLLAVSAGDATIRAFVGDLSAELFVTVEATLSLEPVDVEITIPLHVANSEINPAEAELLGPGDSLALGATLFYSDDVIQSSVTRYYVHPSGELAGQLFWYSMDPSVAVVSGHGIVQAIAPGTATIVVDNPWSTVFPSAEMIVTVGNATL